MPDDDLTTGTWVDAETPDASTVRVRKCRLEVLKGPDAGKSTIVASPAIVIGREGGDLVLTDKKVSSMHVEIRVEPGGYRLRDLDSTNGTFVWGMRVLDAFIGPGAVLALGDSTVRFEPLPGSVELPLFEGARYAGLIGASAAMRWLFQTIEKVARSEITVLVTGETGVGKERVAEAIHDRSPRAIRPFVVLDCSAVPGSLFEDQLFGHDPGAFTGAVRRTRGVFEEAHTGTLFIDEIGELPLEIQSKLLRAVETRRVRRLGSHDSVQCDVRLVAATHRDLRAEVNRGTFRSDLYFRLAVAELRVPPLRERPEDIPLLVSHFLDEMGKSRSDLPADFLTRARSHAWPGNVRELRNAVHRALYLEAVPGAGAAQAQATTADHADIAVPFKEAKARLIDDFERRYVTALLDAHDWNITAAARASQIDRMSMYKMLQRLGIRRDEGT